MNLSFFAAATPLIGAPIPNTVFLFDSVIIGLFRIFQRKSIQMKKGSIRAFFCACDKVNITPQPLVGLQY